MHLGESVSHSLWEAASLIDFRLNIHKIIRWEEEEFWKKKDPVLLFEKVLEDEGILDAQGLKIVANEQKAEVGDAVIGQV